MEKTNELKKIIESLIFASEEEITSKQIMEVLDSFNLRTNLNSIDKIIEELNDEYTESGRAFEIIGIAGAYQFATKKEYAGYIGKLYTEAQRKKLSQQAIETLSIIAYKQPITRSEIEFIRGVNADYIVNSLLERDLIYISGRANTPGRPILYGTTPNFLKVLGFNSLDDLPKLKEINEILKSEKIEGITESDIELFNSVNKLEEEANGNQQKEEETRTDTGDEIKKDETPDDKTISDEKQDENNQQK